MWTKRVIDIIFSSTLLVIFSPVILITALLIKLASSGGVFCYSKRIGQNKRELLAKEKNTFNSEGEAERRILDLSGKPFYMITFRIVANSVEGYDGFLASLNVPRLNKIGSILVKAKIEKIPCLVNVFKGDMSIVGPRPQSPNRDSNYGENESEDLRCPPGIIDPLKLGTEKKKILSKLKVWRNNTLKPRS